MGYMKAEKEREVRGGARGETEIRWINLGKQYPDDNSPIENNRVEVNLWISKYFNATEGIFKVHPHLGQKWLSFPLKNLALPLRRIEKPACLGCLYVF